MKNFLIAVCGLALGCWIAISLAPPQVAQEGPRVARESSFVWAVLLSYVGASAGFVIYVIGRFRAALFLGCTMLAIAVLWSI